MSKLSTYHPRGLLIDGFMSRKHPNYSCWNSMKSRLRANAKCYESYAGRGIDMDPHWLYFANFCSDMGLRPSLDYTIERIDNDKGYWPWNCKWATRTEQCLNRRVFKNNSTGHTGINLTPAGRFTVWYTVHKKTHTQRGSFATLEEAINARCRLADAVNAGKDLSDFLEKRVRYTSKTQIRGVSKGTKGGYIARGGYGNNRVYLGYFKTIIEAHAAVKNYEQTTN